jgi:hypothetical protein
MEALSAYFAPVLDVATSTQREFVHATWYRRLGVPTESTRNKPLF